MGKPSIVSMARGGVYAAAVALPGVGVYKEQIAAGATQTEALETTMKAYAGIRVSSGEFDWEVAKRMYMPIVAWSVIDIAASKFGVWRRMGRLIGNLNLMG